MAKTRLNDGMRNRIKIKLITHAFADRESAAIVNMEDIFVKALDDIIGKAEYVKLKKLPSEWFKEVNNFYVNAGGWKVALLSENSYSAPAFLTNYTSHDLKDQSIVEPLRAIAVAKEKLKEEKTHLSRELYTLLRSCSMIEAFIEAMPEAEPLIKGIAAPVKPANQLVTTGKQVMCLIAKARGEERDGCCDGTLVVPVAAISGDALGVLLSDALKAQAEVSSETCPS